MKVCIIVSNFYPKISKMLIKGAVSKFKKKKILNFKIITVSGTFEIPVVVSNLIDQYDAFVTLGCVIKGETAHFDFLCYSVFSGLVKLSIKKKKPVINGILTCTNKSQALARSSINKNNKGKECVKALVTLLSKSK